jgi:hypothetical protein
MQQRNCEKIGLLSCLGDEFLSLHKLHCSRFAVSLVRTTQFSSTCSAQSDTVFGSCSCQFPWCALALILHLATLHQSTILPWSDLSTKLFPVFPHTHSHTMILFMFGGGSSVHTVWCIYHTFLQVNEYNGCHNSLSACHTSTTADSVSVKLLGLHHL